MRFSLSIYPSSKHTRFQTRGSKKRDFIGLINNGLPDVIGGLQALHDRYSIGESTSSESGSLALTTKAAPSSGAIYLQTGRASSGESGTFSRVSGAAVSGNSGSISPH